jgi:hypothetical protein
MLLNVPQTFVDQCVPTEHSVVSVVQKRGDALRHLRYPINRRNNIIGADYDIYTRSSIYHSYPL